MTESTQVIDRAEQDRFELLLDGQPVGFAQYTRSADTIVFTHTVVEPEFEGRGLGAALVEGALDAARAAGLKVVAKCPFVRHFITTHPAYADLVA